MLGLPLAWELQPSQPPLFCSQILSSLIHKPSCCSGCNTINPLPVTQFPAPIKYLAGNVWWDLN